MSSALSPSCFQHRTYITATPSPRTPHRNSPEVSEVASKPSKLSNSTELELPPSRSPLTSAKLAALHARLSLSPSFPLETLGRCLIDASAVTDPKFNNATLANLGNNLLGYFISEHLIVKYPRLPLIILKAAIYAYVSPHALYQVGREWGVEDAFEPTLEVDAGLLQFKRLKPGTPWPPEPWGPRLYASTNDESALEPPTPEEIALRQQQRQNESLEGIPLSHAMANFVKAVFGAIYLHESFAAVHQFFRSHILTRHLDVSKLFNFCQPTRHLARLCAREGFDPPVVRLLSETGRSSRSAVYVVGAYSGAERLGEGYGASQDEARIRAAVSALKRWYLYQPPDAGLADLPSKTEIDEIGSVRLKSMRPQPFKPAFIDVGEVVV